MELRTTDTNGDDFFAVPVVPGQIYRLTYQTKNAPPSTGSIRVFHFDGTDPNDNTIPYAQVYDMTTGDAIFYTDLDTRAHGEWTLAAVHNHLRIEYIADADYEYWIQLTQI